MSPLDVGIFSGLLTGILIFCISIYIEVVKINERAEKKEKAEKINAGKKLVG